MPPSIGSHSAWSGDSRCSTEATILKYVGKCSQDHIFDPLAPRPDRWYRYQKVWLMDMPTEILDLVLQQVVLEDPRLLSAYNGAKRHLYWTVAVNPNLLLVSRRFSAIAKDVITRTVLLDWYEKVPRDLSTHANFKRTKTVLELDGIPSIFRDHGRSLEFRGQIKHGGFLRPINVARFKSLRNVSIMAGRIESLPHHIVGTRTRRARNLLPDFEATVNKFKELADPDVLSPADCSELVKGYTQRFQTWRAQGREGRLPRASEYAVAYRLRSGVNSVEALLLWFCERMLRINRNMLIGLPDSTRLRVDFYSKTRFSYQTVSTTTYKPMVCSAQADLWASSLLR